MHYQSPCLVKATESIEALLNNSYVEWGVFGAVNALDILTTSLVKHKNECFVELNPVVSYFMDTYGFYQGMALNTAMTCGYMGGLFYLMRKSDNRNFLLAVYNSAMCGILANNIYQIIK